MGAAHGIHCTAEPDTFWPETGADDDEFLAETLERPSKAVRKSGCGLAKLSALVGTSGSPFPPRIEAIVLQELGIACSPNRNPGHPAANIHAE